MSAKCVTPKRSSQTCELFGPAGPPCQVSTTSALSSLMQHCNKDSSGHPSGRLLNLFCSHVGLIGPFFKSIFELLEKKCIHTTIPRYQKSIRQSSGPKVQNPLLFFYIHRIYSKSWQIFPICNRNFKPLDCIPSMLDHSTTYVLVAHSIPVAVCGTYGHDNGNDFGCSVCNDTFL